MDHDGAIESATATPNRPGLAEDLSYVLPSRAAVLAACGAVLVASAGPILVTGEPGVGKTWVGRRLASRLGRDRRPIFLDLAPSTDPAALFRTIGHALGVVGPDDLVDARLAVADQLREESADGRRLVLIVDEAQAASDAVLEEVRILSNRLGRADGFAGLVLLGQTHLLRRLNTRPLSALASRIASKSHLRSIDADEALDLLTHLRPRAADDHDRVERLHRDAAGNPRRLLQLAGGSDATPRIHAPASPPLDRAPVPLLGPGRPPIHLEDNLIEVGWDPDATDRQGSSDAEEADIEDRSDINPERAEPPAPAGDEPVEDHYAALQAWNEWAQNQGRSPADLRTIPEEADVEEVDSEAGNVRGNNVWADAPDHFAPYSQLFSRLRQPNEPD